MPYGMEVFNSSGRTVFTTEDAISVQYCGTDNTAGFLTAFPTTSWTGNPFILARPSASATAVNCGRAGTSWGRLNMGYASTNVWREIKYQNSEGIAPSGNGLVVYDGTGIASSDIIFSATDLDVSCELVAQGVFVGSSGNTTNGFYSSFSMDAGLDKGRYYVYVTNTLSYLSGAGMGGTATQLWVGYQFRYTAGEIRMLAYQNSSGTVSALTTTIPYAIFYVRNGGTTDDNFT